MAIKYEPGEPEITESAIKFLKTIPTIKNKIRDKILSSLGEHLFNKSYGNKEVLSGNLKGY